MRLENRAGYPTGYVLSFVVTSTMPSTFTNMVANSRLSPEDAKLVASFNSNDGVLVNHFVQVCALDEIRSVCVKLVAEIDGSLIESARKFAQSYLDSSAQMPPPESDDLRAPVKTPVVAGLDFEASEPSRKSYKAEIASAEDRLNTVYAKLRSTLSDAQKEGLRREDLEWIARKDATPGDSPARLSMIRRRTMELEQRLNH